jgi:hypothetical protein
MNEADLALLKAERLRQEIRAENRRFMVQFLFGLAAAFSAGFMLGRLWR